MRGEKRSCQDAHSGNGQEPLADGVLFRKLGNPAVEVFPFLVESGELGGHGAKRFPQKRRHPRVVRIVHQPVQFVFDLGGGDLQDNPVLGQDSSHMVDRGRPELDNELSGPVQALEKSRAS